MPTDVRNMRPQPSDFVVLSSKFARQVLARICRFVTVKSGAHKKHNCSASDSVFTPMDDLFKRISELMGEKVGSDVYHQFVEDLKESPLNARALYFFPETGFSLITINGTFIRAFLNVCTPRDPGHINPFEGQLMGDISPKDSREKIRQKLDGKLTASDDTEDQFDCAPLTFFVKFDADSKEICSLSLGYREDALPEGLQADEEEVVEMAANYSTQRPIRKRVGPRHKPNRN